VTVVGDSQDQQRSSDVADVTDSDTDDEPGFYSLLVFVILTSVAGIPISVINN